MDIKLFVIHALLVMTILCAIFSIALKRFAIFEVLLISALSGIFFVTMFLLAELSQWIYKLIF